MPDDMNTLLRKDWARVKAERAGADTAGPWPSRAVIEAKREELAAAGKPSGLRSLAKELFVSVATVRRRLGLIR